jgi:hypothetical protein
MKTHFKNGEGFNYWFETRWSFLILLAISYFISYFFTVFRFTTEWANIIWNLLVSIARIAFEFQAYIYFILFTLRLWF